MKSLMSIAGIKLVIYWIISTAIGSFLALPVAQILLLGIERVVWVSADEIIIGGLLGLFPGIGQWLALRTRLARSGWWILSSLFGGMVVGTVANQVGNQVNIFAAYGAYGVILGIFQWFVLRGWLRSSGIWILASGIAWALGSQAIVWLDRIALESSWPFSELVNIAVMYGLLGALAGAITGAVLAWMIQNTEETTHASKDMAAA